MGFLDKINVAGVGIDKAERYGASLGLGYLRAHYNSDTVSKIGAPTGAVAVLAGLALRTKLGGGAVHLERLGDALVMDSLSVWATRKGAEAAGRNVAVVPKTAVKGWGPHFVGGAVPPAKAGPFLTAQQIANFARRR